MTSFLRTRKDRHPKPENKNRLHQEQQNHDSQRSGAVPERMHHAYDEHRNETGDGNRTGEITHKSQNGNTYGKAH